MRIFHLLKYTQHGAGNVCAAVDLACAQAKLGHKVYVCSSIDEFEGLLSQHGVEYIRINQIGRVNVLFTALFHLYWAIRARKIDIVHAHMIKSAILAAILRPFLRFKLVTTVHNEFQRSAIVMRLGQRVIGVSEAVTRSMIRRGIPASKMRTVLNGTINSVRRPAPRPEPLGLQRPAIASICGMHPRKGVPDLIKAFQILSADHPDAHLYLVGSGPMQDEYRALAATVSETKIKFFGHMDDPRPVLLGADVFVLASHEDPAPLAISEAKEAGCAIVASDVDGIPEMAGGANACVLVPPAQPEILAEAISGLLNDPDRLADMRARSQTNLSYFTIERVAEETEKVYRELLNR